MFPLPLRTRGGVSIIHTKTTSTTNINTTSTVKTTQQRLPLRTRPRLSQAKLINTADKTKSANHTSGATFATKQRARMPTPCRMICAPLPQRMEEHHQRWQAKLRAEERDAAAAANKARRAKKVADRRSRSPSVSSSPDGVSDGDEGIAVPVRSRAASPAESLHSYFASDDDECESGDEDEEMSDAETEDEDDSNNASGTTISPPVPSSSASYPFSGGAIHPSTLVTNPKPTFNALYSTAEQLHSNYISCHTPFEAARDGLRALQDQMPWGPYKKAVAELGRDAALRNKRASPPADADATRQFNRAHLRCALWNTYGPGSASVEVGRMWAAARR